MIPSRCPHLQHRRCHARSSKPVQSHRSWLSHHECYRHSFAHLSSSFSASSGTSEPLTSTVERERSPSLSSLGTSTESGEQKDMLLPGNDDESQFDDLHDSLNSSQAQKEASQDLSPQNYPSLQNHTITTAMSLYHLMHPNLALDSYRLHDTVDQGTRSDSAKNTPNNENSSLNPASAPRTHLKAASSHRNPPRLSDILAAARATNGRVGVKAGSSDFNTSSTENARSLLLDRSSKRRRFSATCVTPA